MKQVVHFSYDLIFTVRTVLSIFIEKQEETITDKSKKFASYDVLDMLTDSEIENLLERWSDMNDGKTTLFENGLEDAEQMWKMIWESDKYIEQLGKHICSGYSGSGIYDKITRKFSPCNFTQHYDAIKVILEGYHQDLWKKHQAFIYKETTDCSEVDNFIMNNLVLIGSKYEKEYYTVAERRY
ncbi:hypothetical protein [Niameybacter massiliensis]|uniref:hypothetical protein n=1 Tax=Niameybacter massiliensis TaxID=1658108 RepID=UPI0006B61A53|nr:hypothetical protein [Niameybacter massiliensis]